jgi:hypothetical protein
MIDLDQSSKTVPPYLHKVAREMRLPPGCRHEPFDGKAKSAAESHDCPAPDPISI